MTVGNSSDEDNENVEERSNANTTVDEGRQTEGTASKSKKKKRLGTMGPVKNVKSKKPKKSLKKECTVRINKGGKEEIGDKKKSAKVTRKKEDAKEDKSKDGSDNNDGEMDEDSEEKVKPKWSFPPKKAASSSTKKKKVEYTNFSVVKMGCNKCTEVFYSKGGYNDHLYHKHKIKNVSKYLPTILNTIWQWLPTLTKPVENDAMRFSCPKCDTKFFEKGALENMNITATN